VALDEMVGDEQFVEATNQVKETYPILLKESIIVKVLTKKSLEGDSLKVFFKSKDQIYQASLEMNPVTEESKLVDFLKIGSQVNVKSQVTVSADLCYGY